MRKLLGSVAALALLAGPPCLAQTAVTPAKVVPASGVVPPHVQAMQTGDVSGVANGGTGQDTFTSHCVPLGQGTSALHCANPSTAGQVLEDNGASTDPAFATISAVIDQGLCGGSCAQGDILYRGASAWSVLTPGTAGYFLQTNGASANPSWQPAAGGSGGSGGGGVATPGTIKDLVFWWESDNILATSGVSVSGGLLNRVPWSPLGAPVVASSSMLGALGSSTTLNSLAVVNFPGSNARYNTWVYGIANVTIFVVFNPTSVSQLQPVFCGTTGGFCLSMNGATHELEILKDNVSIICTSTTALSASTWYQVNATYTQGSACAFRVARAAAGSSSISTVTGSANYAIGYDPNGGGADLAALVAAIIVYDRVLSGPEITSVENYLNAKWGV